MRVVIDTNVLISAVLRDRNPEAVILWILQEPGWEWIVSAEIMAEYIGVLERPKFGLSPEQCITWQRLLQASTVEVTIDKVFEFARDPKDAKFLACALSAKADFLLTGDQYFSGLGRVGQTIVVSVAVFQKLFMVK